MKKDGKKAYIKPSMGVYPLCDKILGPEGGCLRNNGRVGC